MQCNLFLSQRYVIKILDRNTQEMLASENILVIILSYLLLHFIDILVDSTTHMVGSYGPKNEEQSYMTPVEEAPSGMLMRGAYKWVSLCFVCGTFMPGVYWSHSE